MTSSNLYIPRQHRAIPIVVSLTDTSADRLIYSRNYLRLFHTLTNNLTPEVEEGIAQYQLPTQSLVLGDTTNLITRYSSTVQDILKKQTQQLLQQLNPVYPYPEGETLDTAELRVIVEAFDEYPPGTIVYIRQTNIATIQFLLPHIVVNLETGIPKVVGLSALPQPKDYTNSTLLTSGSIDWTQISLSIASTLSFALPMPFGVFVAAGFQFIEMLFSSLGGSSVLDQLLKDFVIAVDDVLTVHEIATDAATIQLFASWLQKKLEVMKRLCNDNPDYPFNNEYILGVSGAKGFLEELQEQLTPGGNSITTAVYNLDHLIKIDDYDIFEPSKNTIATISLYVTGISLSLMGQKMVIQLLASVEYNYNELAKNCQDETQKKDYQTKAKQYQDQWRAAYNEFEIQIYGIPSDDQEMNTLKLGDSMVNCSSSVTAKLDEIKTNFNDKRLTQIGNTYHYEYTIGSGGMAPSTTHAGWTWKDDYHGDKDDTNCVWDASDGCCTKQQKDVAEQNRNNWINTLKGNYSKITDPLYQTVDKWKASIYEWNKHLAPPTPTSAPTIDPKGWTGKAPNDPNWKTGNNVAYAVKFYNYAGRSDLGPYSEFTPIQEGVGITLINLPKDVSMMATRLDFYRCIKDANGQILTQDKLCGGIGIDKTAFQDVGK